MMEPLRVDAGLVREAGGRLQTIAGAIPPPPTVFSPTGADPLSTAIATKIAEIVDPVIAQLPITKEELIRYAQNVMNAAGIYDVTDRQLAEEIRRRFGLVDDARGGEGGGPGAAGVGSAAGVPTQPGMAPAAGVGQEAGQLGQMMQMPMQLAQQAAQIPMQLAGMAAAIPQAMMQGVQSAVQQSGQLSEMAGDDALDGKAEETKQLEEEAPTEDEAAPRADEAGPATSGGERVPESQSQEPVQEPSPAPKPAPTRPAESTSEIVL
ncbi:hypothetical protein [Mycolicibacterium sp. XJ1819]